MLGGIRLISSADLITRGTSMRRRRRSNIFLLRMSEESRLQEDKVYGENFSNL
jgi:hypothetical protein